MKFQYINYFKCIDYHFNDKHSAGSLVVFKHPCIGYLKSGQGEFLYEGKKYTAKPGDLVYIARGSRYYSVWSGTPEIHFYSFNYSFSKSDTKDNYPFQILKNIESSPLDNIMDCYEKSPMKSLGLFILFLDDLYKKLSLGETCRASEEIMPALIYMSDKCTEKIRIGYLAQLCNLSESHFYFKFKKCMGYTPIEYKNNLIIQKSLDMLSNEDKSIEEISSQLGFSNSSYFRRTFKSIVGKTPKELRKQK